MYQLILVVHVLLAVSVISLVLLQHGKGADIGAAFGSGASQTVFGSAGSGSFMLKLTGGLAAAFFATSIILGAIAVQQSKQARQIAVPVSGTPARTLPEIPAPAATPEQPTQQDNKKQ